MTIPISITVAVITVTITWNNIIDDNINNNNIDNNTIDNNTIDNNTIDNNDNDNDNDYNNTYTIYRELIQQTSSSTLIWPSYIAITEVRKCQMFLWIYSLFIFISSYHNQFNMALWRNGSASDSRSEGCVFKSRRGHSFSVVLFTRFV